MLSFYIYVQYFAIREAKVFLGVWNIDKFFHMIGGTALALFLEWLFPKRTLLYLIFLVGIMGGAWEVFEVMFLPDVTYFANHSPDLWRFDVVGDIVAAFLGGYGYWVFFQKRADLSRMVRRTTPISV